MGAYSGPELVDDGLVLALDAANTRSYGGSGTTWTDVSYRGNNGTLTNGPVFTQEPSLEPFGGAGAVSFDGSDYLEIPASSDFSFTTAPWTFEFWVYHKDWTTGADGNGFQYLIYPQQPSHPSYPVAIAVRQGYYIIVDSANYGSPWSSSYNNIGSYGTAASLNTWNHVAYTRDSSGVDRIFVNGTLQFSATGKTSTAPSISSVARFGGTGSAYINGYISNLRLIKGTALYTSNFTPKRQPLIPESAPNTVLLTCQKGTIRDRSPSAHSITINGDAKSISGASYFDFDGTNVYVAIASNSDFDFGTGNYTIEAWIYINDGVQQYHGIFGSSGTGSDSFQFQLQDEKIRLSSYTTEILVSDAADVVPFRQWTHVVISRSGTGATDTKLYKNGSLIKSGQDNINWGSYNREIGRVFSDNAYDLYGKIAQVKVYKGKGLTAAEVLQNYQNTKSRYGL